MAYLLLFKKLSTTQSQKQAAILILKKKLSMKAAILTRADGYYSFFRETCQAVTDKPELARVAGMKFGWNVLKDL